MAVLSSVRLAVRERGREKCEGLMSTILSMLDIILNRGKVSSKAKSPVVLAIILNFQFATRFLSLSHILCACVCLPLFRLHGVFPWMCVTKFYYHCNKLIRPFRDVNVHVYIQPE